MIRVNDQYSYTSDVYGHNLETFQAIFTLFCTSIDTFNECTYHWKEKTKPK